MSTLRSSCLSPLTKYQRPYKFYLPFIVFLCCAHLSYGQQARFGISSGINLPTLAGDSEHTKIFVSYNIGMSIQKALNNKFDINSGIIFSGQGYNSDSKQSNPQAFVKCRLYYFNLPATIDIKLDQRFAFRLGSQFGLLANASQWTQTNFKVNSTPYLRSYDLSLITGIRIRPYDQFQLSAQYNWGLLNINDRTHDQYYFPNRVIQISATYFFKPKEAKTNE